jgi:hydrophobic/amphiphilic exporter-1 (mainly G- bacteria), HAE1 family
VPSFSLKNPHTIIVGALIVVILGATAFTKMPIDVFPDLHIKAAVVATFYPGYAPSGVEQNITSRYERQFTLGSGIEHVTSRSLPGISLVTVYFHEDANLDAGVDELATLAFGDLNLMPPGTLPPFVFKYDASSAIPAVLVTVAGPYDETELQNEARYNVRNFLGTVQGASVPYPFGGKIRQIMAYVNRDAMQARGLTPMDVVTAVNNTNQILPSGDAKIGNLDYYIMANAEIPTPEDLDQVPIRVGKGQAPVLFGDVGKGETAAELQYNKVLIDGKPAVYIPVFKQTGANTLKVIQGVKEALPEVTGMPKGGKLGTLFSQEDTILDAVHSLEREGVTGTILASFMILIFLGNLKSTFAIFLSIPLSIFAGLLGLYSANATINIMTLGGFTLAIGRLIDDSTVVLENINRHLASGEDPVKAARDGANEVTYAVLASTVTTIIVFLPVVFLFGVSKHLFSALALAVAFSMGASYVVAMSVIPLFCAYFLTAEDAEEAEPQHARGARRLYAVFNRYYNRFNDGFARILDQSLNHKVAVVTATTVIFALSMLIFPRLGMRMFPRVDTGKFVINITAPPGTRLELTTDIAKRINDIVHEVIPPHDLKTVVANLGVVPNVSSIYTTNSGEDTGQIMVALNEDHTGSTFHYEDILRDRLKNELPDVSAFFTSGSVIDAVLNFGSAAPIDVQFSGPMTEPFPTLFKFARQAQQRIEKLPQVNQAALGQIGDYPTLKINIDRTRAARLGVTARDVVANLITALDNNEMIAKSIWIDPASGDDYYLSAQYFENDIKSLDTIRDIPVGTRVEPSGESRVSYLDGSGHEQSILLRDVATISRTTYPSEADHYNIQRVVDLLISPRSEDLGGTLGAVKKTIGELTRPPGVKVYFRGGVEAMRKQLGSFQQGFILTIVLVYLIGVAQGRSWLDPFIFLFSIPMGLIGVAWILWATNTTINIESMMGIIIMIGIVHSNVIVLIDFANERRREGMDLRAAVVEAARVRMRPILMTTFATVVGLIPVGFGIGERTGAAAPLARTVIGGLLVSTFMTLFLAPALWELFYSWKGAPYTHSTLRETEPA